jgi:hypothetical protein
MSKHGQFTSSAPLSSSSKPPIPAPVYRVGITGHRPHRLLPDTIPSLTKVVNQVLQAVASAVAYHTKDNGDVPEPLLLLVSQLAEGTDRLVAEAALANGYKLQVVLPFPVPDYESDFKTQESVSAFRALLAQSTSTFEFDAPADRDLGYQAAGLTVLAQCDVLIAVWDGGKTKSVGGTLDIIERANAMDFPVVIIGAHPPHEITFRDLPHPLEALAKQIGKQLKRPLDHSFWAETWPVSNPTLSYTFLRLIGERQWTRCKNPPLSKCGTDIRLPGLRPYYAWLDTLALHYGEHSRSSALLLQVLALAAVACALLTFPLESHHYTLRVLAGSELLCIVVILTIVDLARRYQWHKRWLLYRSLAEQIRCLDFLLPLGRSLPTSPAVGFASENEDNVALSRYMLAAVAREQGIPNTHVDNEFLTRHLRQIEGVTKTQAQFHREAAERYEAVERVLRHTGTLLFLVAALFCLYDVLHAFDVISFQSPWLATGSAMLPALGATAAGVAAQGELKRLASRSDSMSQTLERFHTNLQTAFGPAIDDALSTGVELNLNSVAVWAEHLGEILIYEVRDWQILVAAKPVERPS